jgi:tetratricopeptide (TPR) repeat protein
VDTAQIEQKLARRPRSPLFARLADAYVRDGRTESAKELLLSGIEKYPDYPAAHLVLARCYAAEANYPEALVHLRISVSALPEVEHLLELEEQWEGQTRRPAPPERVLQPEPESAAAVAEAEFALVSEPRPAPAPVPSPEPAAAAQETRVPQPAAPIPAPVRPAPSPAAGRIEDGRIVSKTLAEIYAMQGEYGEAIITYTMLKHHRPQMSAECDLRISELEQALQAKLKQQKAAVSK